MGGIFISGMELNEIAGVLHVSDNGPAYPLKY